MRIDVSEPVLCGCDTCVQHRTLCTQETEPTNVILTSVPVSSGPVQALGSTSDQSSGTETPLAPPPPVTTSVNPEPAQSINSTIFKLPPAVTPVSSEPVQALSPTASGSMQGPAFGFGAFAARRPFLLGASATSQVNGSSPISFAPPVTSVSSAPVQALGTATTAASSTSSPVHTSSPTTFQFHPAFTSASVSGPSISGAIQAPPFGSGASTSSPFDAPSPLRWGSMQTNGPNTFKPPSFLPAQDSRYTASDFPPSFGYPGGFARPDIGVSSGYFGESHFSSPSGRTPKNPFGSFLHPGFGVRYPSNLFGPNSQTTTPVPGRSSFLAGVGTEQGSRYPRYAPTPDFDYSGGPCKQIISISASNSHGHKSHEELRWEDYKYGDKGGIGWFPPPAHTPSLFAPPSIPDRPRMRTIDLTHQNMSGFPIGYNIPTAVQSPREPAGVSSPASGCTVCGATSISSPPGHLGLNNTTNPPSSATSLPGLSFSTYGSCPLLFATPNLAAYGIITTPAVQAYAMMFGTPNLAARGTITTTPAVQAYPMMFGIPNLAAQGTATAPAVQPYPMMFGTPNLAAQGTTTAPAVQPYPMMFGTPNLAAQEGTTTTPAVQAYPTLFGTPNLAAQEGSTTTPAVQAYPTIFGTPNLVAQGTTTTPAVQPYAMMFGTPNLGAQGITPAAQPYPMMFGTPGTQGTTTTPVAQPYPMMFGTPNLVAQGTTTTPAVQPYAMMFGTPNFGAQGITPSAQAYPVNGLNLLPFSAMSLQ
ncbi:hypothetical protein N665_0979s0003 [Sinapis alba]|nr:hypothetical protein N665_0979s0003 [Sinapis alba]